MTARKGKVIYLHQRDPEEALERLNRITGLQFSRWPQSLCSDLPQASQASLEPCVDDRAAESTASSDVLLG